MDFMKVFDQTVREIKREVNLKVLKVPEIEQKVLDATDDEPWGPHGTALAEIAQATKKFTECQMVMNVLWTRLAETGRYWRFVYKTLTVIEYLVAHGSERAVDDIIEHTFQISSLASFEYVEPSGKDMGINVRKKAENIVALLNDKDKMQEVRNKAAANRDKYVELSSSGITYKSGSASFSSSRFQSSDNYGGFGSTEYSGSYSEDKERYGEDKYESSTATKSRHETSDFGNTSKKGSSSYGRSKATTKVAEPGKQTSNASQSSIALPNNYEDDFDDFDPRASSNAKPSAGGSMQVDLFGDLLDASAPTNKSSLNSDQTEVDLFGDATFVSATSSPVEAGGSSVVQTSVNLFASQPATSAGASLEFFASPDPVMQPGNESSLPSQTINNTSDPFAAFPLNSFDSEPFGAFNSHTGPASTASPQNISSNGSHDNLSSSSVESRPPLAKDNIAAPDPAVKPDSKPQPSQTMNNMSDPFAAIPLNNFDGSDSFGAFTSHTDPSAAVPDLNPNNGSRGSLNASSGESKSPLKDNFQVKSGIWADSLSRGLIDLNITAPKKVNLADVGIVGGLMDGSDEKDKAVPSFYMGRAMGTGSGYGKSGFTSSMPTDGDDFFSSLSNQNQFGSYRK